MKMVALPIIFLVCLTLACTLQAAPRPMNVKPKSELPLSELQLLTSVVSQALIQETDENKGMTKTYCKLLISALKTISPTFGSYASYCNDIDYENTYPENDKPNTELAYKIILEKLKRSFATGPNERK